MEAKHYYLSENITAICALIILLIGFTFLEWATATETIKQGVKDLMFIVATFYFGGSRSSAKKDETLAQMANNASQPTVNLPGDNPQVTVNSGEKV